METVLKRVDFVPLGYFFSTRFNTLGLISTYLILNIGFCLLAITVSHEGSRSSSAAIFGYLATWVIFAIIYELGYLLNDSWSAERERARGFRRAGTQKPVVNLTRSVWTGLIVIRLPVLLCLGMFLARNLTSWQGLWVSAGIAATAITFIIHNSIFPPYRWLTFAALYILRYVICVPFLGIGLSPALFGLMAAPIVLMYTIGYVKLKASARREYYVRKGILVSDTTICAILAYCAYVIVFHVAKAVPIVIEVFIIYLLAFDVILRSGSLYRALRGVEGRQDIRYHVHSSYSHDSKMSLAGLRREMEVRKWHRLYLAEHEEDFSPELYSKYKDECQKNSGVKAVIVAGLEYNILQQHILALGLKSFLPVEHNDPSEILRLYPVAERVVWAHPSIALRKLYDLAYVWQMFRIGMLCEAVEWFNRKSERTGRNGFRSRCLCMALCWIRPGKRLIHAEDAHSFGDFETADTPLEAHAGVSDRLHQFQVGSKWPGVDK